MIYLAIFLYLTSGLWCYIWTLYESGGFAPFWYSILYAIFNPVMIWYILYDSYRDDHID